MQLISGLKYYYNFIFPKRFFNYDKNLYSALNCMLSSSDKIIFVQFIFCLPYTNVTIKIS